MDASMVLLILVGLVIGFYVGRWSAEFRRARFDANAVWNGRRRYRGK